MTIIARVREPITLDDIGEQAETALAVLDRARGVMLAPNSTKESPKFSLSQLADMLEMDRKQVDYRLKKGDLPAGSLNASGSRREFTLAEVRLWMRHFHASRLRPEGAEGTALAITNFKGGVSKTTTAMILAQGLSLRGHKCLVIDLDAQGSLTTLFGILPDAEVRAEQTVLPLFLGDAESIEYAIRPTYWDGIDLVPATAVLYSGEFALPSRQRSEAGFQFWNVLNYGIEQARQDYDVIIIDSPPSLSYTTINGMMAADGLVMPLPPSALDFASSVQFWDLFWDLTRNLGERGRQKTYEFINVVLSKVDASDIATGVVREWIASAYGSKVLPVEIPKTATASSAAAEFGSIYDMRPGSAGNRTIKRAMDAYETLVGLIETQLMAAWARQLQGLEESA